jgi:hypothetical protein
MADDRSAIRLIANAFEVERVGPAWLHGLVHVVCCPFAARPPIHHIEKVL